jgi:hypothetical protein
MTGMSHGNILSMLAAEPRTPGGIFATMTADATASPRAALAEAKVLSAGESSAEDDEAGLESGRRTPVARAASVARSAGGASVARSAWGARPAEEESGGSDDENGGDDNDDREDGRAELQRQVSNKRNSAAVASESARTSRVFACVFCPAKSQD